MSSGRRGIILIELVVAAGMLAVVVVGMAAIQFGDARALRAQYVRAIAMEIVDGEMETLLAGEWRAFGEGTHAYALQAADAARNLPDGTFTLTVRGKAVRLEWTPAQLRLGGRIVREGNVP